MRFFLILGVIAVGLWMGWNKLSGLFGDNSDEQQEAVSPVQNSEPSKPKRSISETVAGGLNATLNPNSKEAEVPKFSKRVKLEHRQVPDQSWLSQVARFDVETLVDPVSRTVLLSGPVDKVNVVADALESGDVVSGSCGAQAFVVYVSKSAQKGYDFYGAFSEAVNVGDISAELSGQGLALDLGLGDVRTVLDVLRRGAAVEVIQRPHVRLLDGQEALVEAVDQVPVPETTVSDGIAQTSINYRNVGLRTEVSPIFLGQGRVRLLVLQENGVIGQTVAVAGSEVPLIQTQTVSSAVELSVGQSVVLGGVRTYRREVEEGLFSDNETVEEGTLYVILATYNDVPRATAVEPDIVFPEQDFIRLPGRPASERPRHWFRSRGVLPDLNPRWSGK